MLGRLLCAPRLCCFCAALVESHVVRYSPRYDVYVAARDTAGNVQPVVTLLDATTSVDQTPPSIVSLSTANVADFSLDVVVTLDESGTCWYVYMLPYPSHTMRVVICSRSLTQPMRVCVCVCVCVCVLTGSSC